MKTVLFISPHLDDAVFSCGGAIQRVVADGNRALIATVFSHGCRDHVVRRKEDKAVAKVLGADVCWLGLRDAPWRSSFYRGFREIILGTAPGDSDESVAGALASVLNAEKPIGIFAPLAVGTHIDHRLTFTAIGNIVDAGAITFYEDRPYAFAKGAVDLRLRQLGCTRPFNATAFFASFRRLPHVRRYLPSGDERVACEGEMIASSPPRTKRQARSKNSSFTAAESATARDAAEAYVSQWKHFAGSRRAWARRDREHARSLGFSTPRVERYWILSTL